MFKKIIVLDVHTEKYIFIDLPFYFAENINNSFKYVYTIAR